jgi:hypothetical protein
MSEPINAIAFYEAPASKGKVAQKQHLLRLQQSLNANKLK